MAIHKLTDLKIKAKIREIENLQFSPQAKNALIGDGQGLYLGISKNATASWLFRYMDDGKAKSVGLGGYPATPLVQAREKAQALRDARTMGKDPVLAKKEAVREQRLELSKGRTFEACALEYIKTNRKSWKNAKHAQQWTNTLTQYAFTVIGKDPISHIQADDIVRILKPIWEKKHETATRLRGRIESILDWATVSGWRTGDNPARFKGHMEYLLPKVRSGAKSHHASLPYEKLPDFMLTLQSQSGMARYALEMAILCCSRTGEIVGATWDEFDLAKAIWTIPKERMKASVEHRVPLGKRALRILEVIKPFSGKKFVFKTGKKDAAMSSMGMAMCLRRLDVKGVTVHGMRSTFRNWAGEKTNYSFQVCEQALAHSLPDAVAAAYLRSDFFVNRVNLMQDWETFARSKCKD